jgi:hypothetical protein
MTFTAENDDMTDLDIIDAAARMGVALDVALSAIALCSDPDERDYYAANGFRALFAAAETLYNEVPHA